MKPTKSSDAQKIASMKWTKKNKEQLNLALDPGVKDAWKGYAEKAETSLAKFISAAVQEKAEKEGLDK